MSEVVRFEQDGMLRVDPAARGMDIAVRPATQEDFGFIDMLQKQESDKVGFMVEQAIRKRIEEGNVLIAEAPGIGAEGSGAEGPSEAEGPRGHGAEGPSGGTSDSSVFHSAPGPLSPPAPSSPHSAPRPLDPSTPISVGYCLGVDRYMKRGDVGIIYQMAVVPEARRCNVAALLLQAQFDKSAYGTRLYCCWCKQSLEANRFWEAMGFVPLAFRAAGRSTIEKIKRKTGDTKGAVHVFWQKPVRAEDVEQAGRGAFKGWWYPYETSGGAMMESRVILPLPPETQWDEATPVVLPGAERREQEQKLLAAKVAEVSLREREVKKAGRKGGRDNAGTPAGSRHDATGQAGGKKGVELRSVGSYGFGAGSGFGDPPEPAQEIKPGDAAVEAERAVREAELLRVREEKAAAKQALKAAQRKSDPEVVSFARELRDRWQECVAAQPGVLEGKQRGKYAVGRLLGPAAGGGGEDGVCRVEQRVVVTEVKRLDAA